MQTVGVVIVTFNSSRVIGRLLDALQAQSHLPNHIVVVDNNSTDDTVAQVATYKNLPISVVALPDNKGGAGGFYHGLQKILQYPVTTIFTFDDDCYPKDSTFIAQMLESKQANRLDVLCPLVVDVANPTLSAYQYHKQTQVSSICQTPIITDIKLFNGVAFDRAVIDTLEGPKPEFFIRGDEEEFKQRIVQQGYSYATDTRAIVYHPSSLNEYVQYNNRRYHHHDTPFKLFYSTRNRFYLLKIRRDISAITKVKRLISEFWRYTHFYLWHKKDVQAYRVWLQAYLFGLAGYMNNSYYR